jgi:hypothetical protein
MMGQITVGLKLAALLISFLSTVFSQPRRAGRKRWCWIGCLTTLYLLAGCETTPPVPEPIQVEPPLRPVLVAPSSPRRVLGAVWSFTSKPDRCVASAANSALTLTLVAEEGRSLSLELHARAAPEFGAGRPAMPIAFAGQAGSWRVQGRPSSRGRILLAFPLDETSASRVLVLLSGGTLEAGRPESGLPLLLVPAAGPSGQVWFECVRRQLF